MSWLEAVREGLRFVLSSLGIGSVIVGSIVAFELWGIVAAAVWGAVSLFVVVTIMAKTY